MLPKPAPETARGRKIWPTHRPNLGVLQTDDGSKSLIFLDSGDTFHSTAGAVAETRHVYLQNSGVAARLNSANRPDPRGETTDSVDASVKVLEIGLGTGLGLLLTIDLALQTRSPVHFVSLELDWMEANVLEQLDLERHLAHPELAQQLIQLRRQTGSRGISSGMADEKAGQPQVVRWSPHAEIEVEIWLADVADWSPPESQLGYFDAIYFDPFSASSSPELWTLKVLQSMRALLQPHGTLTTYSCARSVRSQFEAAGFQVGKRKGPPGGKRESLVATLDSTATATAGSHT